MNIIGHSTPAGHSAPPRSPAIQEAIQHHIDRLASNQTKAAYSPEQQREANKMRSTYESEKYQTNAPAPFEHNIRKVTNFAGLTGKNNTFQQLGQMFNPTTKAGIVNLMGMLGGGPKGDASEMMGNLGMKGQFESYGMESAKGVRFNPTVARALDRGLTHEGPINPTGSMKGAGIRGLTRRAKGVGGYNRPNEGLSEMARIEALRRQQSKISQTNDKIKDYANRTGFAQKQQQTHSWNEGAMEAAIKARLVPFEGESAVAGNRPDIQSRDYTDRMRLLNLQKQMPGNELLGNSNPIMKAIWDMLFAGKGLPNPPMRP